MPDIEVALERIEAVRKILRPFNYYVREATLALEMLDEMEVLLKNPTEENIRLVLDKVEASEKMIRLYEVDAPDIVRKITRHSAKLKEALSKA